MSDPRLRPTWAASDRAIPRLVVQPLQQFVQTSTAAGGLLVAAAVVALVWANGPWGDGYERLWTTPVNLSIGPWTIAEDLRFWVDEGLMTLFFLAAGLEIKRELVTGELRELRAAVLPIVGAISGMLLPFLIYRAVTHGTAAADGWGIALPTDLAFGLGVLALAARAAPPGLRAFLLSLAIADDLLTVLVVGVFYSEHITGAPLALAGASALAIYACRRAGIRHVGPYIGLGIVMWGACYAAGIHPAIVGAIIGLLAPTVPFQRPARVSEAARRIADATEDMPADEEVDAGRWLQLSWLAKEAVSPLSRVEAQLVPWVNLAALPLFALGNAGVRLRGGWAAGGGMALVVGLVLARLVGKTLGISGGSLLAARAGFGRLPTGVRSRSLLGMAAAAGPPFTVSLFVAEATFADRPHLLAAAEIGVLLSIVICALASLALLRIGGPTRES